MYVPLYTIVLKLELIITEVKTYRHQDLARSTGNSLLVCQAANGKRNDVKITYRYE